MSSESTEFLDIETALYHANSAKALWLEGDELEQTDFYLPSELTQLQELTSLSITGYKKIHGLNALLELPKLQILELDCYWENTFPDLITELHDLKSLCIRMTARDNAKLPKNIGALRQLEKLELEGITIGNEIGQLAKLQHLATSSDNATSLPDTLVELPGLNHLDLSYSGFRTLPKVVCRLHGLRHLNISHTAIDELPIEISNLNNLQELLFAKPFQHHDAEKYKTRIKQIRQSWGGLSSLQKLDLSQQHIIDASIHVRNWNKLEDLNLSYNDMEELPEELFKLHSLKILNLNFNQLHNLPDMLEQWPQLEYLSLIGNPLTTLPASLLKLKYLQKLDLRRVTLDEDIQAKLKAALTNTEIIGQTSNH